MNTTGYSSAHPEATIDNVEVLVESKFLQLLILRQLKFRFLE